MVREPVDHSSAERLALAPRRERTLTTYKTMEPPQESNTQRAAVAHQRLNRRLNRRDKRIAGLERKIQQLENALAWRTMDLESLRGFVRGAEGKRAITVRVNDVVGVAGFALPGNFVDIIAVLPSDFGVRPLVEADFLVEVKDPRLADAKTPLEALGYLESVIPFIELPDLMLEGQFSGNAMIATNVAFRGGVTGMEIPVQKTQAFLDALANMTVVMTDDADNKEIGRVKGSVLMDNPINAAMWLAKELKKDGIRLKKGDLLSLGGFINPVPPKPGMKARVQYIGLPGDPQVTVEFN